MLNLPRESINKITKILLRQQKQVTNQLKEIEKDDPMTAQGLAPEASESGTDSWMADVHTRITMIKNDLGALSVKITKALSNIKKGTYGKCEKCGKQIEKARLEAMPTATICMSCSKKPGKK